MAFNILPIEVMHLQAVRCPADLFLRDTSIYRTIRPHMRSKLILFSLDNTKRDLTSVF